MPRLSESNWQENCYSNYKNLINIHFANLSRVTNYAFLLTLSNIVVLRLYEFNCILNGVNIMLHILYIVFFGNVLLCFTINNQVFVFKQIPKKSQHVLCFVKNIIALWTLPFACHLYHQTNDTMGISLLSGFLLVSGNLKNNASCLLKIQFLILAMTFILFLIATNYRYTKCILPKFVEN